MFNNVEYNVPAQVKNLFYGHLAPFSDYVIFTESRNNTSNIYVMYERQPWERSYTKHTVSYSNNGYVYSKSSSAVSDISIAHPYYCFSSEPDNGVVEVLPSVHTVSMLCLVVVCGCLILKTIFGGIKVWKTRKTVY